MLVLLDNILVYSQSEDDHEKHLRLVIQVLRKKQLYAKLSKCSFYQRNIQYLGNIILKEGITIDLEKIVEIAKWTTPKNVIDIISFMGMVGYYHRFIKWFFLIAHPITSLQRKDVKFHWSKECEVNF